MHAVPGFQKAQERLRMKGCSGPVPRGGPNPPFAYVQELDPPQRQQVARCCRNQDDEACERLSELLPEAAKIRIAGGKGLDWDCLSPLGKPEAEPAAPSGQNLSWGEIRDAIKADIAPSGPEARDHNPFVCVHDLGFFGVMYPESLPAQPEHQEKFCLYTPDSIQAHRSETALPLVPGEYS